MPCLLFIYLLQEKEAKYLQKFRGKCSKKGILRINVEVRKWMALRTKIKNENVTGMSSERKRERRGWRQTGSTSDLGRSTVRTFSLESVK